MLNERVVEDSDLASALNDLQGRFFCACNFLDPLHVPSALEGSVKPRGEDFGYVFGFDFASAQSNNVDVIVGFGDAGIVG